MRDLKTNELYVAAHVESGIVKNFTAGHDLVKTIEAAIEKVPETEDKANLRKKLGCVIDEKTTSQFTVNTRAGSVGIYIVTVVD